MKLGDFKSRQEDPEFTAILEDLEKLRIEINNLKTTAKKFAKASKNYTNTISGFCTDSILEEEAYRKEAEFSKTMSSDLAHSFLDTIEQVRTNYFDDLKDSLHRYKTAKLNYDNAYHKTHKKLNKGDKKFNKGDAAPGEDVHPVQEQAPDKDKEYVISQENILDDQRVHANNHALDGLKKTIENWKKDVLAKAQVVQTRLEEDLMDKVKDLEEDGADHHKVILRHFRERVSAIALLCHGPKKEKDAGVEESSPAICAKKAQLPEVVADQVEQMEEVPKNLDEDVKEGPPATRRKSLRQPERDAIEPEAIAPSASARPMPQAVAPESPAEDQPKTTPPGEIERLSDKVYPAIKLSQTSLVHAIIDDFEDSAPVASPQKKGSLERKRTVHSPIAPPANAF